MRASLRLSGVTAVLLLLGGSPPAIAQSDGADQRLEEIERRLEADESKAEDLAQKAEALSIELQALRAKSVAEARQLQDLESELTRIEQTLATLEEDESRKAQALSARRRELREVLAGLQRLALVPPEALLVTPGSPLDAMRSGLLLNAALTPLENEAEALKTDLAELTALRREIEQQRRDLEARRQDRIEQKRSLDNLLARKKALQSETEAALASARGRAERLADEARDLKDLMARLEAEAKARAERQRLARVAVPPPKPQAPARPETGEQEPQATERIVLTPPEDLPDQSTPEAQPAAEAPRQAALLQSPPPDIRAFPSERGQLVLPARGRLAKRFGEGAAETGVPQPGVTFATRPGAQVVAPFDGRVAYARSFRGYGLILIIEHDGQYHSLLSGFRRLDVIEGQWVLAGEPVGVLSGAGENEATLYLELRRNGKPIDPLPWLAMRSDKVRG